MDIERISRRARRPRPGAVATVVAALVVLAAGACLPKPTSWRGEDGPHVGIVGDSLVHGAETGGGVEQGDPDRYLSDEAVARHMRASVSAMIGAGTDDLDDVEAFPEPGPDVLVVALGTNDMYMGKTPTSVVIDRIVDYIGRVEVPCTAVVTIVDEPSWGLDVTAPLYNAALAELDGARADVIVADWAPVVDAHPEYLRADGVHHTAQGSAAYRDLILDAAEECLGLFPPTTEPEPTTTEVESTTTESTTTEPESTEPEPTTTTEPLLEEAPGA